MTEEEKCPLCGVINGKSWDSALILEETENFDVFPGTGAFVEGYLMIVPRQHVHSIALLPANVQNELFALAKKWQKAIKDHYGVNVLMIEAGTDRNSTGKHAHSVVHAHVHLFPVDMPDFLSVFGSRGCYLKEITATYMQNLDGKAYFLVGYGDKLYICDDSQELKELPSQFHRQVVADYMGKGEVYDWRTNAFQEKMRSTYQRLK